MAPQHLDVGFDADGVIYPFVETLGDHLAASTGRPRSNFPPAQSWNFFCNEWGMSPAEFFAAQIEAVRDGYLFATGRCDPADVEAMRRIVGAGHRLHIITARSYFPGSAQVADLIEEHTRAWFCLNQVPYTSLTFSKDKTCVRTDVFIEDNVDNFETLRTAGVDAYLIDRAWNTYHITPHRVASVTEFADLVFARATATAA